MKWSSILLISGIASINALAFIHVKAMTKFTGAGSRTQGPEDLSGFAKVKVLLTGVTLPRPENARTPGDMGLSFQTHHYPNPRRETLEAWHIPAEGDEILILLFHGYGASKESLLPMAKQLNALGWSTFLVDFFGSGGSTGDRTTIGFLESEDVTASFNYAQKHWPNAGYARDIIPNLIPMRRECFLFQHHQLISLILF